MLEHKRTTGQSSHINHGQQQQREDEGEKSPRLPYKITQFCELLSQEELSQLYEGLFLTHF